jgi:hypothetical protein
MRNRIRKKIEPKEIASDSLLLEWQKAREIKNKRQLEKLAEFQASGRQRRPSAPVFEPYNKDKALFAHLQGRPLKPKRLE